MLSMFSSSKKSGQNNPLFLDEYPSIPMLPSAKIAQIYNATTKIHQLIFALSTDNTHPNFLFGHQMLLTAYQEIEKLYRIKDSFSVTELKQKAEDLLNLDLQESVFEVNDENTYLLACAMVDILQMSIDMIPSGFYSQEIARLHEKRAVFLDKIQVFIQMDASVTQDFETFEQRAAYCDPKPMSKAGLEIEEVSATNQASIGGLK